MPSVETNVMPEWARKVIQAENLKGIQLQDFSGDPNLTRKPDYYIYIFNISHQEKSVCRPPSWPCVIFAACEKDKPYKMVGRVANTVNERWVDSASGTLQSKGLFGERFATDLLNPSNLGTDIWQESNSWVDQGGCDLTKRGLFWSYNEVPTAEELAKAKSRMITHYNHLLQQATELASQHNEVEINPEHHAAADYLKVRTSWHTAIGIPEECPVCGGSVKPKVAYHVSEAGGICVLDWRRTVESGVKSLRDVPKRFRSEPWYLEAIEDAEDIAEPERHGPGRPRKTE